MFQTALLHNRPSEMFWKRVCETDMGNFTGKTRARRILTAVLPHRRFRRPRARVNPSANSVAVKRLPPKPSGRLKPFARSITVAVAVTRRNGITGRITHRRAVLINHRRSRRRVDVDGFVDNRFRAARHINDGGASVGRFAVHAAAHR